MPVPKCMKSKLQKTHGLAELASNDADFSSEISDSPDREASGPSLTFLKRFAWGALGGAASIARDSYST